MKDTTVTATFVSMMLPFLIEKLDELEGDTVIYRQNLKRRAKDLKKEIELTLDKIYTGATKEEAEQGIDASNIVIENLEELFEQFKQAI